MKEGGRDSVSASEAPPSEEELEVMRLVIEGLTDQAIAHRLRVAVITVRRRIRSFRERVGADTRLQAAVIAARRGWL